MSVHQQTPHWLKKVFKITLHPKYYFINNNSINFTMYEYLSQDYDRSHFSLVYLNKRDIHLTHYYNVLTVIFVTEHSIVLNSYNSNFGLDIGEISVHKH